MTRSPVRRAALFLAFTISIPAWVMGCPKKQPAVEDAQAPAPPPASTPTVTELAPLTDDGGEEAEAEASAPKKYTGGPAYNANQLKVKQCCNAMRTQAKAMGSSPEAFQINNLATQCDMFAAQIGAQGNAPEFNQLRQILKSVKLPSVCQF